MSKENLYNKEAQKKLKEMVTDIKTVMFATNLASVPLSVVPMHTKEVDDSGNIWFLSASNSDHNRDIKLNSNAQLLYSDPNDMKFISIFGDAKISNDKETIKKLYSKMDNAWFDGPGDPNATAIQFTPREAVYWSNDDNKLVTLFKLGMAALTGKDQDLGSSGKLEV